MDATAAVLAAAGSASVTRSCPTTGCRSPWSATRSGTRRPGSPASLVAFAPVTIATIVTLTVTVTATVGGYRIRGRWLELGGNILTAAVLAVIGGLVLAGVL